MTCRPITLALHSPQPESFAPRVRTPHLIAYPHAKRQLTFGSAKAAESSDIHPHQGRHPSASGLTENGTAAYRAIQLTRHRYAVCCRNLEWTGTN
jgi:hypothetical protein